MRIARVRRLPLLICVLTVIVGSSGGCQSQSGGATELPREVIVWEDPETGDRGSPIRDVNNDEDRIVVVGTNGDVQFVADGTVCNDCDTEEATITIGSGDLIDIRFGVRQEGDQTRRPFLVDRNSGNFIELVGSSNAITFQVTSIPLEDPNDSSDDLAIRAGSEDNPTVEGGSGSGSAPLCGILGFVPLALGLLVMLNWRKRR